MDEQTEQQWEIKLRKLMRWVAVTGTAAFTGMFFWGCIVVGEHGFWDHVVLEHSPTMLGLPAAAIASLGLVLLLRTVAGPIKFKTLGLEFSGAAGPIIMWI